MSTLPPILEKKVLTSLIFTESFETIIEETKESRYLVAEVLKWLIKKRYVSPMQLNDTKGEYEPTYMYDTDNMRAYHYRMTADGLRFLGEGK